MATINLSATKLSRESQKVNLNKDLLTSLAIYKDAQLSRLQFEYNLLLSGMELCRLAGIRWW